MWAHPGKQLLFMGAEFGQESEWAESRELDWWLLDHPEHLGVHRLVKDLNRAYAALPRPLGARGRRLVGFQWIDANDAGRNVFSFIRRGVSTSSPATGGGSGRWSACRTSRRSRTSDYRLGLPSAGKWDEVVNTDAATYTGSGVGNLGSVTAARGRDHRPAGARHPGAPPARDGVAAPGLTTPVAEHLVPPRAAAPTPVVEHLVPPRAAALYTLWNTAFHNGPARDTVGGPPCSTTSIARPRLGAHGVPPPLNLWRGADAPTRDGVGRGRAQTHRLRRPVRVHPPGRLRGGA